MQAEWGSQPKRRKPQPVDEVLPEVADGIMWRKRGGSLSIWMWYFNRHKWCTHQCTVQRVDDAVLFQQLVRSAEKSLLDFVEMHHFPPAEGSVEALGEGGADAPAEEGVEALGEGGADADEQGAAADVEAAAEPHGN